MIISVLGAYLAWTLMASEVMYVPATTGDMPRFLTRVNARGPGVGPVHGHRIRAGAATVAAVRLRALDFVLDLTCRAGRDPLPVGRRVRRQAHRHRRDLRRRRIRRIDMPIAFLAVAYTTFLVYAAGPEHLLLSCLLYAPAAGLYVVARREHNARIFTRPRDCCSA